MAWILRLRFGIDDGTVLNGGAIQGERSGLPDPTQLGEILFEVIRQAASEASRGLDYGVLADSQPYRDYSQYLSRLASFDPSGLATREERLAFWVNLYNGMMLDAVIQWHIEGSVRDIPGFFWKAAYRVGGLRYSANDIEHGILRGNSPHPALPLAPFTTRDRRRAFSLEKLDPRVHFALVCASSSCPVVAVYSAGQLDQELDQAAHSFVRGGGVRVEPEAGRILLSRIFQWYAPDFGGKRLAFGDKRPLLDFIVRYLEPAEAQLVQGPEAWAVRFMAYDWSLNGQAAIRRTENDNESPTPTQRQGEPSG